jgi:hypothetical protein
MAESGEGNAKTAKGPGRALPCLRKLLLGQAFCPSFSSFGEFREWLRAARPFRPPLSAFSLSSLNKKL